MTKTDLICPSRSPRSSRQCNEADVGGQSAVSRRAFGCTDVMRWDSCITVSPSACRGEFVSFLVGNLSSLGYAGANVEDPLKTCGKMLKGCLQVERQAHRPQKENPWRTFGVFHNDPAFSEAVHSSRRGRELRQQQNLTRKSLLVS